MKAFCFSLFLCVAATTETFATTYYVRTDGNDANDGLSNSSGGAWLTIDYAADNVTAGDVIRVQSGNYAETVTPGVNGTAISNMVTLIADGVVTVDTMTFTNNSYIRVVGFVVDADLTTPQQNGCVTLTGTCSFLEFWDNTFRDALYNGIRMGASDVLNTSLIIGNTCTTLGIGNYSGVGISIRGSDNIISHNTITDVDPDAIVCKGDRNRYLNNYIYGLREDGSGHPDVFQTGSDSIGWEQNLFEATFQAGIGTGGNEHHIQIANGSPGGGTMSENIFRRNVWHNMGSGGGINQATEGDISYTRWYNNNTVEAQRQYPTNRSALAFTGTGVNNTHVYNNIEYEAWGTSATVNINAYTSTSTLNIDYNLAFDPDGAVTFTAPWTDQTNSQDNADPDFDDVANDDFTLGASSNATGNAGHLTQVNEPVDTTGSSFDVDDAGFFRGDNTAITQYGGNLVVGDTITVGTDTKTIVSISSNTITVDSSFTWANNDNVYYGDDTTPDIGAYPYFGGNSYVLSATLRTGTPNVVTVSDTELVRWVVWFENGLPVEVDNAPPYEYTDSGGTVTANAYSLFASKSPVVQAAPPTALLNVSGTLTIGP